MVKKLESVVIVCNQEIGIRFQDIDQLPITHPIHIGNHLYHQLSKIPIKQNTKHVQLDTTVFNGSVISPTAKSNAQTHQQQNSHSTNQNKQSNQNQSHKSFVKKEHQTFSKYNNKLIQFQQMQQSETSSIQFKSNYPLENYFLHQQSDELGRSRGFSNSDLSSNLFSPGQQRRSGSDQFDQFLGQDSLELEYRNLTPDQMVPKLQSRRTQIYTRTSGETRQLFSTQAFEQPRSDRSRSHSGQKSQSGIQKNGQQPMSPYIIHVPSIDGKAPKTKEETSKRETKKTCDSNQNENQDENEYQNEQDDKSTSTVMQCDTEYLTTRDNDVVIEKPVPSYEDV